MFRAFIAIIALVLLTPLAATAETDLCDKLLPPEMAVGTYRLTAHDGTMSMMGRTMPWLGGGSDGIVEMHMEGDQLVMTGDSNLRAVFSTQDGDRLDWWGVLDDYITKSELDRVDIQLCPITQSLPRLLADGTGHYFEGGPADFKMRILVIDVTDQGIVGAGQIHIWGEVEGATITIDFPFDIDPV